MLTTATVAVIAAHREPLPMWEKIAVGNRRMVRKGMSNPVAAVVAVAEELADEEKSSANHHTRTDSGCYRRNVVFQKSRHYTYGA